MGSSEESRASWWEGDEREREKAKRGAYGDRKLNPHLYHFTLGRPSGALEHSIQIYVKELSHTFDLQRSPGCYSLNNLIILDVGVHTFSVI